MIMNFEEFAKKHLHQPVTIDEERDKTMKLFDTQLDKDVKTLTIGVLLIAIEALIIGGAAIYIKFFY